MPAVRDKPIEAGTIGAVLVAVRQAADAICDRWSFSLVAAARAGESRFAGFMNRTGMASRLVTSRLRELERLGVFVRVPYSRRPLRHAYELTPMGRALLAVLNQMERWERNWPAKGKPVPLRCAACGKPASARDIDLKIGRTAAPIMPPKQTLRRRSILTGDGNSHAAGPLARSLDVFGDKWGIELLICAFLQIRRFNEMRAHTGITANILSDRLGRLEGAGLLQRSDAAGYRLTESGIDLYGVIVAVQDWADDWLPDRTRSPLRLIHKICGQTFHPAVPALDR